MKIAVTSSGETLSATVDRSFGRCKWFIVADIDTDSLEVYSNTQNLNAAQGAGIQAARNIAQCGAEAVITGNVGPNAFRTLNAAAIRIFIFDTKVETVAQALSEWKAGRLTEITEATVEAHWV